MSTDDTEMSMVPESLHRQDGDGTVHITAQGIDLEITPEMFDLAESEGGLSMQKDVPRDGLRSLYEYAVEHSFRVSVEIEPISEKERHGLEDE